MIEDKTVKVDCNGKASLVDTAPRRPGQIEACAISNPGITSCRRIARALEVALP
jgi:hypothetical protein